MIKVNKFFSAVHKKRSYSRARRTFYIIFITIFQIFSKKQKDAKEMQLEATLIKNEIPNSRTTRTTLMMIKKHDCSDHYCKGNHEKGPKNSNCQQKHLSFFPFATEVRNLSYLILSFVSAPSSTSSMKVAMLFPDLLIPTASLEKASLRQIDLVHKYKQKLAGYIFDGLPMFHASSYNQKMWLIYNKLTLMQVTANLDRYAGNPTAPFRCENAS